MVGFARWTYPVTLSPEQAKEKDEREKKRPPHPEGANGALMDDFFGQLSVGRKKWDAEKMYRGSASYLGLLP